METSRRGEQERILSLRSDSRYVREQFKTVTRYKAPILTPVPFDPSVQLKCPANRTSMEPDHLGRNPRWPR